MAKCGCQYVPYANWGDKHASNKWQLDHQFEESSVSKSHDNQRIISA